MNEVKPIKIVPKHTHYLSELISACFFSFFVHRLNIFCEQRADGRLCISAF